MTTAHPVPGQAGTLGQASHLGQVSAPGQTSASGQASMPAQTTAPSQPVSTAPRQAIAARPSDPAAATVSEQALVPVMPEPEEEAGIELAGPVARLPVELDVAVPVREFRVRNLLALELGQVIETEWVHGEDLPLSAGEVQLAWSEFEVVDTQLAVRLTRLA